jgi:hypothetical protein
VNSASIFGVHFLHFIVFGGWGVAVAIVLIWPTKRGDPVAVANGAVPRRVHEPILDAKVQGSRWIQGAFLGTLAAAGCHLAVMPQHFGESWVYGTFFLGAAICQIAFASLLLTRPSRRILVAGIMGSVAIVVLWSASRFVGVPIGPDHGSTESIGVLDTFSTVAETITIVFCAIALVSHRFGPAWRWSLWSLNMRLALLATAVGVPILATVSNRG